MKIIKMTHLPSEVFGDMALYMNEESMDGIFSELEEADIGESFKLEIIDMPKGKFEQLPEFSGWL